MEFSVGNFKIITVDDYDAMSKKAATIFAKEINNKPGGTFGFATGSTPVGMYKELIALNKAGEVNFSKITTFNLDEYSPIEKTNIQSYEYFMNENLFNHINIDKNNINIPNGEAKDVEKECIDYEQKIKFAGGIEMQILGIGLNGHIGFNEPGDHFTKSTNFVKLSESTIEANARFFKNKDDVPKNALSMGIGTIMSVKKILLLLNGEKKADIIEEVIYGKITPLVSASILQLHGDVTVILDKSAAVKILKRLK